MLTEVCAEIRNYFLKSRQDIYAGVYTISDGSIEDLPFLIDGQYFRIVGSALNDGVYKYPVTGLKDETFEGSVWAMYVPPAVVKLSQDIDDWLSKNANALDSPYQSESFGGYSYTMKTGGGSGAGAGAVTWQGQFANRLNSWRKI